MGKRINLCIHKTTNQLPFNSSIMSCLFPLSLHVMLIFSAIFLNLAWSQSENPPVIEIHYRLDGEPLDSGSMYVRCEA